MIGSIVLAGAVLKLRILYMWNFGGLMLVGVIILMSTIVIINVIDRKGFAAYSSVLHISLCVILRLMVILLVRYMHIVLSPLIFISVYMMYNSNGSRFYMKVGLLIMMLWMVNFGLPFLGSFFSEVYVMQNVGFIVVLLVVIYIIVMYIMIKSINIEGLRLFYIPWLVLYVIMM